MEDTQGKTAQELLAICYDEVDRAAVQALDSNPNHEEALDKLFAPIIMLTTVLAQAMHDRMVEFLGDSGDLKVEGGANSARGEREASILRKVETSKADSAEYVAAIEDYRKFLAECRRKDIEETLPKLEAAGCDMPRLAESMRTFMHY